MKNVKVYGADWCPLTARAKDLLNELDVPFQYINVEEDPAASEWVKRQNDGKEMKPTIDIDGQILTEPSDEELAGAVS